MCDGLSICSSYLHRLGLDQLHGGVGFQVLHDTLRHKYQRADYANRQQNPQQAARGVHPEVAELVRFFASDAADDHDGQHDADRGGGKIVIGQARHLGEIAHRALTAVSLPIRVCCKGSCGPEGQGWINIGKFLWIKREPFLCALDDVEKRHGNTAEQKHGYSVFRPAHLALLVDAGQPIHQPFDGAEDRIEKRLFAVEHSRHEHTQGSRN